MVAAAIELFIGLLGCAAAVATIAGVLAGLIWAMMAIGAL